MWARPRTRNNSRTIFFVVFQVDLVLSYIQGFVFTLKDWACLSIFNNPEWEKYQIGKQIRFDVDIGMLWLVDVFLDSRPQVLLQLYYLHCHSSQDISVCAHKKTEFPFHFIHEELLKATRLLSLVMKTHTRTTTTSSTTLKNWTISHWMRSKQLIKHNSTKTSSIQSKQYQLTKHF
jgi:hypothetical protein